MFRSIFRFGLAILLMVGLSFSLISRCADAGIVGAWLLDGNGNDSSGNGNNGEPVGNPAWVPGKFGQAMKSEPNKYIDFPPPKSDPMELTRDFTVMAWTKPNEWVAGWNCIFSMQAGSTGGETYGIYFGNQGGTQLVLWTRIAGSGKGVLSPQGTLNLNEWAHVAVTYDDSKLVAYKNGEPVAETDVSGDLDNDDGRGRFVINGNYNALDGNLSEWSSADIDELLIFDEALSQAQIKDYMNRGYAVVSGQTTAVSPSVKLTTTWGELKLSL